MIISESRIRRIIRDEIVLETIRRFPGKLVPGVWDPARGDREELQDLERQHFGGGEGSLTALAQDLTALRLVDERQGPRDEDVTSVGRKHGFKVSFMGAGASRATFSIGSDLVMKVAMRSEWASRMNKDDYRLGIDTSLRQIAPRAYVHGGGLSGYDWVILERVRTVTDPQELPQFFKCSLLVDPDGLAAKDKDNYWWLVRRALDPFVKDEVSVGWPFEALILSKPVGGPLTMRALRADLSRYSPAFRNLDRVIRKYGVAMMEVREDNLGIGSDGRLVLLDSSIF
jgi:hypothetical protein